MANPYVAAAKVGLDVYAAGEAAKAKQKNDMRNAAIAQQSRKISGNREAQAYIHNLQNLKDQNTSDNFNISLAEANARDQLAMATAGSGIGGASVDDIDTQITREVTRDKVAANRSYRAAADASNIERIQSNENRVIEAENAYVHDYSQDIMNALFQSVGSNMKA